MAGKQTLPVARGVLRSGIGAKVYFELGRGDVILRVLVDDQPVATFGETRARLLRDRQSRAASAHRAHRGADQKPGRAECLRRFRLSEGNPAFAGRTPRVRIEFIGDSHTVGYGNTSATRNCSEDDVWKTTDDSQAFGAKMARHYGADYQVGAISGRGIVRNYDGSGGDPLPEAYPYVLLDHSARYENRAWQPQVIVIALGTNDFSTRSSQPSSGSHATSCTRITKRPTCDFSRHCGREIPRRSSWCGPPTWPGARSKPKRARS